MHPWNNTDNQSIFLYLFPYNLIRHETIPADPAVAGYCCFVCTCNLCLISQQRGWQPYTCNLLEDLGIYKRLKVVATQNSTNGTWEFPALCSFPRKCHRPILPEQPPFLLMPSYPQSRVRRRRCIIQVTEAPPATCRLSLTAGCTFNIQNTFSVSASPYFCVLKPIIPPVTISNGCRRYQMSIPLALNNVVEVTITCSSSPSPGENVLCDIPRTISRAPLLFEASFIGAQRARKPSTSLGTNVKYYVYSSSKTKP